MQDFSSSAECYSISKAAFDSWRQDVSRTIEQVGGTASENMQYTLRKDLDRLSSLLQPVAKPPTVRDAATQLRTVTNVSFTAQVLQRMRAERTSQRACRAAGRLGALAADLSGDAAVLLDIAVVGRAATAMNTRRLSDVRNAGRDRNTTVASQSRTAERHAAARPRHFVAEVNAAAAAGPTPEWLADDMMRLLMPSTVEAVCATSCAYRSQRKAEVARHGKQSQEAHPSAIVPAHSFLRERLVSRFQLALREALEQERLLAVRSGAAFMCSRCRQDGRKLYQLDPDQRQLSRMTIRKQACAPHVNNHAS